MKEWAMCLMGLQEVPGGGESAHTIHEGKQEETERVFAETLQSQEPKPYVCKESWRQPTEG